MVYTMEQLESLFGVESEQRLLTERSTTELVQYKQNGGLLSSYARNGSRNTLFGVQTESLP